MTLKGQCHEIFCFWFFSWTSFPQASDYTIRAVSNFFDLPPVSTMLAKMVEKFATGGKFAAGVADTGGAPWLANISANFRKNLKRSKLNTLGLGGNWFMKKNQKRKISWHCPFKGTVQWELRWVKIGINRSIMIYSFAGKCHLPCPKGHHHESFKNIVSGIITFWHHPYLLGQYRQQRRTNLITASELRRCSCAASEYPKMCG